MSELREQGKSTKRLGLALGCKDLATTETAAYEDGGRMGCPDMYAGRYSSDFTRSRKGSPSFS